MGKIILQPSGSKAARVHYDDTIKNPVSLSRISHFVDSRQLNILNEIYDEDAFVWGVTAGKNFINKNKWDRISKGDTALFSSDGRIFASGTVTYKLHSAELALDLWGKDSEGFTWEYVFFLDEIKRINIPYLDFNKAIGYSDNFIIQAFSVLDEVKSSKIFASFNLLSEVHLPPVSFENYQQATIELDELNRKVLSNVRVEQGFLRNKILGNKTVSKCSICDKNFNVDFLVCAHIKKRSRCDDSEKRNIHNVTPMCKFGCDELFERGYIVVDGGVIFQNRKNVSGYVGNYLRLLEGKKCTAYNKNNNHFFKWHNNFHKNNS